MALRAANILQAYFVRGSVVQEKQTPQTQPLATLGNLVASSANLAFLAFSNHHFATTKSIQVWLRLLISSIIAFQTNATTCLELSVHKDYAVRKRLLQTSRIARLGK